MYVRSLRLVKLRSTYLVSLLVKLHLELIDFLTGLLSGARFILHLGLHGGDLELRLLCLTLAVIDQFRIHVEHLDVVQYKLHDLICQRRQSRVVYDSYLLGHVGA